MSAQDTADLTIAATATGSRRFANQFTIEWTPSDTSATLLVRVLAAGSLLTQAQFDPDNATQDLNGDNGTYSFVGTIIAAFNAPPTTGTLFGQGLQFRAPSGKSQFSGVIGVW
jgi:hypothetical protein